MVHDPSSDLSRPPANGSIPMNIDALEHAAQSLLTAVLTEGQWLPALEALTAKMNVLGGGIAHIAVPTMFALPTSGVRHQFEDFQAGKAPTLTRATPLNPTMQDGFVAEHLRLDEDVLKRDVFYQEFLRPRGCSHHVSALLDAGPTGMVNFLAFRPETDGAFQADELLAFDRVLPYLRAAAIVARGTLNAEARRRAEPFERRGEQVLYLGHDGSVVNLNPAAERTKGRLFDVVGRRLVARAAPDRKRLQALVLAAIDKGEPGLLTLADHTGTGTVMALTVPILGLARDVFRSVSTLVVFLDGGRGWMPDERALSLLRDAVGLTGRKVEVVRLVAGGVTPRDVAARMEIGLGTVRLHLKAAFGKTGVHSQAELTALVRRLG